MPAGTIKFMHPTGPPRSTRGGQQTHRKGVKTVSPWRKAGYVSVDSETAYARTFAKPGEPKALTGLHMIMEGIDAYEMTAPLVKRMRQRMSGQPVSDQMPHGDTERAIRPRP